MISQVHTIFLCYVKYTHGHVFWLWNKFIKAPTLLIPFHKHFTKISVLFSHFWKTNLSPYWIHGLYLPISTRVDSLALGNPIIANVPVKHWYQIHDGVIKWKHFLRYWPNVWGIHRSPVNSLHKGQWRGALVFYLIYAWTNGWVNNWHTSNLRCHHTHYDVTIICIKLNSHQPQKNTPSANCEVILSLLWEFLYWLHILLWPLNRYEKLQVVHALGMPETFSLPPISKKAAS